MDVDFFTAVDGLKTTEKDAGEGPSSELSDGDTFV